MKDKNCSLTSYSTTLQTYYQVNVNISYMLSDPNSVCPTSEIALTPVDEEAYAYARIDVTVTVDNDAVATEPIRIFRRYVENITQFVYLPLPIKFFKP